MANHHYTANEISSLMERFEMRKLPKPEWTHQAHLVVAICYSLQYPAPVALNMARKNITLHNESVGTPNSDAEGYHETITRFWMWVAGKFVEAHDFIHLAHACNTFIDSEFGSSTYPLTYYSPELLYSKEARKKWVEPDCHPLHDLISPV